VGGNSLRPNFLGNDGTLSITMKIPVLNMMISARMRPTLMPKCWALNMGLNQGKRSNIEDKKWLGMLMSFLMINLMSKFTRILEKEGINQGASGVEAQDGGDRPDLEILRALWIMI
jgi:hypothetical protein